MPAVASSAPAVLIAHLAAATGTIRGGLGRRDAAQPRTAGHRRAVRHPRGPASRAASTSASAGPRAPTTGRPERCVAPPTSSADRFPEDLVELIGLLHRRDRPPAGRCPGGLPPRDLAARVERVQRRAGRPARACRSRSPTTSARSTPSRPWPRYRAAFRPSAVLDRAARHGGGGRRLRPDRRGGPVAGRSGRAVDGAAPDRPAGPVAHAPRRPPPTGYSPAEQALVDSMTGQLRSSAIRRRTGRAGRPGRPGPAPTS